MAVSAIPKVGIAAPQIIATPGGGTTGAPLGTPVAAPNPTAAALANVAAGQPAVPSAYANGISVPGTGPNNSATNYKLSYSNKLGTFVIPEVSGGYAPVFTAAQMANISKNLPSNMSFTPPGTSPTFTWGNETGGGQPTPATFVTKNPDGGTTTTTYSLDPKTGYYVPSSIVGQGNPDSGFSFADALGVVALAVAAVYTGGAALAAEGAAGAATAGATAGAVDAGVAAGTAAAGTAAGGAGISAGIDAATGLAAADTAAGLVPAAVTSGAVDAGVAAGTAATAGTVGTDAALTTGAAASAAAPTATSAIGDVTAGLSGTTAGTTSLTVPSVMPGITSTGFAGANAAATGALDTTGGLAGTIADASSIPGAASAAPILGPDGTPIGSLTTAAGGVAAPIAGATSALNTSNLGSGGTNVVNTGTGTTPSASTGTALGGLVSSGLTAAQTAQYQSIVNNLTGIATTNLTNLASAIQGIADPNLLQYINTTAKLVQQGQIDPALALAAVQQQTELYKIQVPPEFTNAVSTALQQTQAVASQGYTPAERAQIQASLNNVIQQQQSEQTAIATAAQARGQYGTGQQLTQEQQALQGAINNASTQANTTQANAYTRSLAAIGQAGQLGLTAGQQSFQQQATVGQAQDAINALNTQLQQQANLQNAQQIQAAEVLKSQQDLAVQQGNLAQANTVSQELANAATTQQQLELQKQQLALNADTAAGTNAAGIAKAYIPSLTSGNAANLQNATNAANASTGGGIGSAIGGLVGGAGGAAAGGAIGNALNSALGGTPNIPATAATATTAATPAVAGNDVIGSTLGNIFSDERVKEDKKNISDEEMSHILDALKAHSFKYDKEAQLEGAPAGNNVGVYAQDVEKSPAKGIVIDEGGVKKIDGQKALSLALAAIGSLHEDLKKVKEKQNG